MEVGPIWGGCQNLPQYALKKAQEELHETDEKRREYPKQLRTIIEERKDTELGADIERLFSNKDDDFLLRFIRARKYDLEKTYTLMSGYVKFRQKYPELLKNLTKKSVTHTLENGFPGILPKRDKEGRVVFIFNIGEWDAGKFPFDEVMRGYVFLLERLIANEETQINGFVLIENFANYTVSQAMSMRPSDLRKMVNILQGSFPARFKAVHFIYEPWYFSWTYSLVKPFLREKFRKRVHVHGQKLDNFFTEFDPSSIPEDFFGKALKYDPATLLNSLPEEEENND